MSCPESNKVKAYVTQSLSKSQESKFQAHLRDCKQCQQEVEKLLVNDTMVRELKAGFSQTSLANRSLFTDVSVTNLFLTSLTGRKNTVELLPGQYIGIQDRYRIIRRLGHNDANVYHAHDNERGHEVVLKLVVSDPTKVEKTCNQISRELACRSSISDYTNIIITYDIHTAQHHALSLILLSMEYADGGNLRDWLTENRGNQTRRIEEALPLLEQCCKAIKIIHKEGLVHRDIKPENILLCRNSGDHIVKLTDFGISYKLSELTLAGDRDFVVAGTPLYMSPEQFSKDGYEVNPSSDIYSLGIVIYEILIGKPPFYGNFRELRDQHLNKQPPKVTGQLYKWGQIVSRCLQKDPEKRYGSVDELINDITRLKKGLAISVDVSCPECDHVNLNIDTTSCEVCQKSLESLFRLCPVCNRQVRLDVELCPGCGQNVASYYTRIERQQRVEILKDENPVEAIGLLELMLRDGAGDFHNRAVELVKELRKKQQKLESLIAQATKAESDGNIEKAIGLWNEVLSISVRHITAKKKLKKLKTLSSSFANQWKKATECMDKGDFGEAEELLEKCLTIMPNHEDILKLLSDCRKRSSAYNKSLENALIAEKSKRLLRAGDQVVKAINNAPKSSKALKLKSDIDSKIKKVETLYHRSIEEFKHAKFDEMSQTIRQMEDIQIDSDLLSGQKKANVSHNRNSYLKLIKQARLVIDSAELDVARAKVNAALKVCPKSTEAKGISDSIESRKRQAGDIVKKADCEIKAARFDKACKLLDQAEDIYWGFEQIDKTSEKLDQIKSIYEHSNKKVSDYLLKKDLDNALKSADTALEVCPDSKEISAKRKNIGKDLAKITECIEKARRLIEHADFEKADEKLKEAKSICPEYKKLTELELRIKQTTEEFNQNMASAQQLLESNSLQEAHNCCKRALEKCPDSEKAKGLFGKLNAKLEAERAKKRRNEQIKSIILSIIFSPVLIPYAIIATAFDCFMESDEKPQIIVKILAIAAGITIIGFGGFWGYKWVTANPETAIVVFIIIPFVIVAIIKEMF